MIKRLSKQLVIALIFLFILSSFGFLIYYFTRPAPSCFDGIQNQSEKGIDCDGPCLPCEFKELEEVEVLWTEALPTQENFYDLIAQFKNPNQNYGSGYIPYQFKLYDAQNNQVGQFSGITFILPNQTKYLVQMKVASTGLVSKAELSFDKFEWQKLEDYQPPQLVIQQKEYRLLPGEEVGFSQARAILINKSNFDFDKIDIDILLFDSSRRLLALNATEVRTLLSGQERDFLTTWFREISGLVTFVEMEAETNIFDPDNYLSADRPEIERFQEY